MKAGIPKSSKGKIDHEIEANGYNPGHSEPPLNTRMLKVIAIHSWRFSMAMVVAFNLSTFNNCTNSK